MRSPRDPNVEPYDESSDSTRQGLNRVLYVVVVISFFLPFATVKSCADEVERTYTGFEMLEEQAGVFLSGVLLLALLLLGLSFRKRIVTPMRRGLVQAWKALLCALAAIGTFFATGMSFLFQEVTIRVGLMLCLGSWLILYLLAMITAIRQVVLAREDCPSPPPPWGPIAAVLLTLGCVIPIWLNEPPGPGMLIGSLVECLMVCTPLVVLSLLAAIRYRTRHPR